MDKASDGSDARGLFGNGTFSLDDGKATLCGHPLKSAHLSRTGVHWAETVDGLGFWTGVLRFCSDRLWLRGYLHFGPDAKHVTRYEVMGAVRKEEFVVESASGKRAMLSVGYSGGSTRIAPAQSIECNGKDLTDRARLEHRPATGLRLHIEERAVPPGDEEQWILGGSVLLDLGAHIGSGFGRFATPGPEQPVQTLTERWTARGSSHQAAAAQAQVAEPVAPRLGAAGETDTGDTTLTVEQLAGCDLSGSEAASQNLIQQNMIWCMDQQWVAAFFPPGKDGQPSRPDFTSQFARMNVIDKDCEWYNMRFAAGFLGLSLDDKMHKLNAANRLRLEYYLGNQIALDPAYTRQTQAIATLAAVTASPVLQQYVADAQTNGTDWGQQLSDYLNAPEQLASIAQQVLSNAEGGMAQIDDYATLLTVFDETGALGTAYYNNVVTSLSAMLALTGDISQDSSLPAWMPDYIDAFVEAYRNGGNRPIEAGPDQTAFDIAEELYEASQTLGNSANLAKLIYTNLQKNPGISLGEQAEEVAAASSTQVTLSKSLYSVFLAAGLVMSIYALANWDELEQDEQAAAMTNLAGVIYSVGANAPDILTGAAWVTSKLNTEIELALEARNTIELVEVFQLRAGLPRPTLFTRFLTWLKPLGQSGQNAFNTAGTRIGTFFKAYPRILNGLGAVISAAALGISIWSLVADVQSGAGAAIIVFDSIQVVLGAVMVVCAVLSVIPVLDFVTGVIGAATAIISALLAAAQFLWNWFNPPSDPVGDFFNALVNPLVAILPDPPAGWAPAQPAEGI